MACCVKTTPVKYHSLDTFMMLNNIFSTIKVSSANIKNYEFDGKQWTTPNELIKTQSKYDIAVED